jgi:hypothetical protein
MYVFFLIIFIDKNILQNTISFDLSLNIYLIPYLILVDIVIPNSNIIVKT